MKKMFALLSVFASLLLINGSAAAADNPGSQMAAQQPVASQVASQNGHAWSQVDQSDMPNNQGVGEWHGGQQGHAAHGYANGADHEGCIVDPATAPQGWEQDMGNGYTCCCTYKPCHYTTCETTYCPQYHYKDCCRYVPQYYQQTRCRYVPQYYCETCCRQVPQHYTTCECVQCPQHTYHQHCKYVPQYTYKCCPQPCCEPCPQPCAPSCN